MDADHIGARIVKGFGHLYDDPPPDLLPPTVIDILGLARPIAVHQNVEFTVLGDMWLKITM